MGRRPEPAKGQRQLHLALHAPAAIFQEEVRASLTTRYRDLVTGLPVIRRGMALAPEQPGDPFFMGQLQRRLV
jgi:L-alanine-DL-glutamate epimerase-like enolase superfamily enzyme